MISFQAEGVEMPDIDIARTNRWLVGVASGYDRLIGTLNYVFSDDEKILETNRNFLNHDYYTDIITFDYSTGNRVGGDIIISLDTVKSNAREYAVSFEDELHRVIVHGLLHLCGLKDKTLEERREMEAAEDKALDNLKDI